MEKTALLDMHGRKWIPVKLRSGSASKYRHDSFTDEDFLTFDYKDLIQVIFDTVQFWPIFNRKDEKNSIISRDGDMEILRSVHINGDRSETYPIVKIKLETPIIDLSGDEKEILVIVGNFVDGLIRHFRVYPHLRIGCVGDAGFHDSFRRRWSKFVEK